MEDAIKALKGQLEHEREFMRTNYPDHPNTDGTAWNGDKQEAFIKGIELAMDVLKNPEAYLNE